MRGCVLLAAVFKIRISPILLAFAAEFLKKEMRLSAWQQNRLAVNGEPQAQIAALRRVVSVDTVQAKYQAHFDEKT